jgi:hypothetical protein
MNSLRGYQQKFIKIWHPLNYLRFHGIDSPEVVRLEKEMKELKRELRNEHHITPRKINEKLQYYEREFRKVEKEGFAMREEELRLQEASGSDYEDMYRQQPADPDRPRKRGRTM